VKGMLKVLIVLALATVICLPGMALATIISVGDPVIVGSWEQAFQENGEYGSAPNYLSGPLTQQSFDSLVAILTSGDGFESPGIVNIASGWTVNHNGNEVTASGPVSTTLNYTLDFLGSDSDALTFACYLFKGNTCVGAEELYWNGSCWTDDIAPPIPLPPTALLLGTGLVGLAGLGWKRRRAA